MNRASKLRREREFADYCLKPIAIVVLTLRNGDKLPIQSLDLSTIRDFTFPTEYSHQRTVTD